MWHVTVITLLVFISHCCHLFTYPSFLLHKFFVFLAKFSRLWRHIMQKSRLPRSKRLRGAVWRRPILQNWHGISRDPEAGLGSNFGKAYLPWPPTHIPSFIGIGSNANRCTNIQTGRHVDWSYQVSFSLWKRWPKILLIYKYWVKK